MPKDSDLLNSPPEEPNDFKKKVGGSDSDEDRSAVEVLILILSVLFLIAVILLVLELLGVINVFGITPESVKVLWMALNFM